MHFVIALKANEISPFTLLYVKFIILGETGLGKSTLMDSLFNTHFEATPSTHKVKRKWTTLEKY